VVPKLGSFEVDREKLVPKPGFFRTVKTLVLKKCYWKEDIEKLVPERGSCKLISEKLVPKPSPFVEEGNKNTGSKIMLL
jgi:hypothetical protein